MPDSLAALAAMSGGLRSPSYNNASLKKYQPLGPGEDTKVGPWTASAVQPTPAVPSGRQGPATPGDADFNWNQYDQWKASTPDPVAEAKGALARTDPTSERLARLSLNASQSGEVMPSPSDAFGNEIGSTVGKASLAALKAPLGVLHPWDAAVSAGTAAAEAIQHPSEIGPAFKAGLQDPEVMGGALGNMLMLDTAEPVAGAGRATVGSIGRGTSALGRGAEALGTKLADAKMGGFGIPGLGVAEAVVRGDPKGLALAAVPYALKYGGKGLQKVGGGLQGLQQATMPNPRFGAAEEPPNRPSVSMMEGPSRYAAEPGTNPVDFNENWQQAAKPPDLPNPAFQRLAAKPPPEPPSLKALEELSTPHAAKDMATQFAHNKPMADWHLRSGSAPIDLSDSPALKTLAKPAGRGTTTNRAGRPYRKE